MDWFRAGRVPFMARRNYVLESYHILVWGFLAGLAEGNVAAVVVAKTFGGTDLMIAVAVASPMFAKLASLVFGMWSVGRRKLPLMTVLASAAVVMFASVAFTPPQRSGGWWFLGQMAIGQVFLAGVVTVRSALWNANYPHTHRGRITARLQLLRLVSGVTSMTAVGLVFDRDAFAYRWVFPAIALLGAVGVFLLQPIRVRNERRELRRTDPTGGHGAEERVLEPFSLVAVLSPGHVLRQMVRVLKENPRFTRYCIALMFTGIGNLMVIPVMASILAHDLELNYITCVLLLDTIPLGVMLITLPRWAPLFDRVGVVRFRVTNGICWSAYLTLGTIATYLAVHRDSLGEFALPWALGVYGLGTIANGLARGGASLAWHLGHYHFAKPRESELLMGVHVTLTGLRGLFIPFLGIWLWSHVGWWVWLIAAAFGMVGALGYVKLARDERVDGR